MQKTTFVKNEDALKSKKWYIIDATDKILGRLSVEVANLLRGKNKSDFTPNVDCGDFVIIVNAAKIKLTSNKAEREFWYNHSGYIGGLRKRSGNEMIQKYSDELIYESIFGMLPKNRLSRQLIKKLHIYKGADHKHEAQKPIAYELKDKKGK